MQMNGGFSNAVGQSVTKWTQTDEEICLHLSSGGQLRLVAIGDCCSHSWFEPIVEESAFRDGAIILKFESDIDLPQAVNEDNQENGGVDNTYGLRIYTTLGVCLIEMGNDGGNNGYYGAWIEAHYDDGAVRVRARHHVPSMRHTIGTRKK